MLLFTNMVSLNYWLVDIVYIDFGRFYFVQSITVHILYQYHVPCYHQWLIMKNYLSLHFFFPNRYFWIFLSESMSLNISFWIDVPEYFFLNRCSWIFISESILINTFVSLNWSAPDMFVQKKFSILLENVILYGW